MSSRRSLQTILFTDIVGSTERARELGDQKWRELLDQHHARVRREIRRFRGREVKSTGDGFLAAFPRPAQAVRCAWAVREALRELDLEVRSGIHMGAVEHHGKDLGGIVIHIGARIASVAEPGEILASNAVRESEMGTGFRFEDRGRHRLKGIEGEWRLFSLEALPTAPYRLRPRLFRIGGRPLTIAGAALVVLVIAAGAYFVMRNPGNSAGPSEAIAGAAPAIAVLPFRVGGEDLEVWREGMVDLVSTNVDVFPELRAVPSRTVLARWREAGADGPVDLARALDVARRTEALYAVSGSVVGTKDGLRIRGEVFDLQTGAKIGETVVEGPPDSIFELVDRLSMALVEPLLSSRSEDRRWPRLAATTTSSPTALKAFLEGEALLRTGEYLPAIKAFQRAIHADSTFALAHYRLAEAFGWTTGGVDSREHVRIAARYADRLPEREARLLRASNLGAEGRLLEWVATLREAVRQHPDDPEAWYKLGEVYYHAGGELLVPPWEFVDAFERSIELDPTSLLAYEHLVDARFQRAPDSARVRAQIDRNVVQDDFDEVAFRLAFSGPHTSPQIRAHLRDVRNVLGMAIFCFAHPRFLNLREAVLQTALERPVPNPERRIREKAWLFWTLVARGHLEAAIELSDDPMLEGDRVTMLYEAKTFGYLIPEETLARALADAPTRPDGGGNGWTSGTPSIFERGAYAAEHGDWRGHATAKNELRKLIAMIEPENATDTLRMRGLIEALDGYAAWRRGDDDRALALLRNAQVWTIGGNNMARSITSERNQIIRAWLGELLLEMGRPREALLYYESLGPGWPISQDPIIYFHLGRIRDQLGDREGALQSYELATLAWRDADPELQPLVQQARQAAIRLRNLRRE
jgi:class 3 adenylate cyclase/tetratricopeptide (TPR) repeat protein